MQVVAVEDFAHLGNAAGSNHDQHPLLRLAQEDLVRRHARLAPRDRVEIDLGAHPATRGELGQRTGQPGRAEVLHGDHRVEARQLEARFHQQLLEERVPNLHGRAPLLAVVAQGCRSE